MNVCANRLIVTIFAFSLGIPAFAKTHKDTYNMSCDQLWPAVKTVLKTSGKYKVISIDSTDYSASFGVGGSFTGVMVNTVSLNPKGTGCEMAVNSTFRGITHNDAGDFKVRVDAALGETVSKPAKESNGN